MSPSVGWYLVLLGVVAAWRLVEVEVSRRNLAWARARGGVESGQRHFPAMAVLHAGLILGSAAEVVVGHRPFLPWLGWPLVGVLLVTQAVRLWCMSVLGRSWNARVVVVPGAQRVVAGPYRWLRHPNYVIVAIEGLAIPLVHSAWITAAAFTVANAILLLGFRIPAEEAALAALSGPAGAPATALAADALAADALAADALATDALATDARARTP